MDRKYRSETKMNRKIALSRKNLKRKRTGIKQKQAKKSKRNEIEQNFFFNGEFFGFFLLMYVIQHYFTCRPSDSTVSEDAVLTVAILALSARCSNHLVRSHPQGLGLIHWLDLIIKARSHPRG
jgi:hypothetical protein